MLNSNVRKYIQPSVFEQIQVWIRETKAIDIASGYPNYKPPQFLKQALQDALLKNEDQYGPPSGQMKLRGKLATYYENKFQYLQINPLQNIFIGQGAGDILQDAANILLNPGDEVIIFDPHFPLHSSGPILSGATVKSSKLIQPSENESDWKIDFQDLETKFTDKTKMIILCSPHNPTGKIFNQQEYQQLADLLKKFPNTIIISDEVYEFLAYDQNQENTQKFFKMANISQEISDRTITIGSLGKLFNATGWRCGYAIAGKQIIQGLNAKSANGGYGIFRPGQIAMAQALDNLNLEYKNNQTYLNYTLDCFQNNRNFVQNNFSNLKNINWQVLNTQGGYFTTINAANIINKIPLKYFYDSKYQDSNNPSNIENYKNLEKPDLPLDVAVTKFLMYEYKVSVLPTNSFYIEPVMDNPLIRISLAKKPETLQKAYELLNQ